MSGGKFVFHDLGGKRWPRARRMLVLAALLAFVAAVLFVQSLLTAPRLHCLSSTSASPRSSGRSCAAWKVAPRRSPP